MILNSEKARVGFGLDFQYHSDYEGGIDGIINKFRNSLSHVSVVNLPENRVNWFKSEVLKELPSVHHLSGIEPGSPNGVNYEKLKSQNRVSEHLDAAWCGEDVGIWSIGPYDIPYFVPPILSSDSCEEICRGIVEVMNLTSVPFLAEVPSFSFVAGDMKLGDFFRIITKTTGCGLVLDLSHVVSYALTTGETPDSVLTSLPLEAVREIHVAGGKISEKYPFRYIDNHSDRIMPCVSELLKPSIAKCPNLQGVTYEISHALKIEIIEEEFQKVSSLLSDLKFAPAI